MTKPMQANRRLLARPWQRLGIRSRLTVLLLLALGLMSGLGWFAMDRLSSARLDSFMRKTAENDKAPPPPVSLALIAQDLQQSYREGGWQTMATRLDQPAWRSPHWTLVLMNQEGRSLKQTNSQWQTESLHYDEQGLQAQLLNPVHKVRFRQMISPEEVQALTIDGQQIAHLGWLHLPGANQNELVIRFLDQSRIMGLTMIALLLCIAVLVFIVLGRHIIEPLQALALATRRLANGELGVSVPINSADEVGQLAQSFNHMSARLAHNEALRKRMVSDVAHELRTPLTGLRCHIESLRDGVVEADARVFDALFHEVLHLQTIVNDLQELNLAEADAVTLNIVATPLGELIAASLRAYPKAASVAELVFAGQTQTCVLETDPIRLRQVLLNVLQNAVKFSPEGGRIEIGVSVLDEVVTIHIRDHGPGVPAAELENIFERFYRLDAARSNTGGSGLGLSISRALMKKMGGSIVASLPDGGGLSILIQLPLRYRSGNA